jgi:serine/threonine protein phosphatase PrpC
LLTWDQNLQSERLRDAVAGQVVDWRDPGSALVGYVGHYAEDGTISPARAATRTVTLLPDEWLILCSDGLTDYAGPEEASVTRLLDTTLRRADGSGAARAMEVCRALVDAANRGGGGDNITVLALTLSADRVVQPSAGSHPS